MLQPIQHILNENFHIILASSSPRRSEILRSLGLKINVVPSMYEEDLDVKDFKSVGDFVVKTAYNKVNEVFERLSTEYKTKNVIIGADTVVSMNGKIYGKPKNENEARLYLNELSDQTHTVYTGVVLKTLNKETQFFTSTDVKMARLDPEVIEGYIESKEPLDKAGGYGIQGIGGSLIEKINGDYYTVMGLPLYATCKHLIELLKDESDAE